MQIITKDGWAQFFTLWPTIFWARKSKPPPPPPRSVFKHLLTEGLKFTTKDVAWQSSLIYKCYGEFPSTLFGDGLGRSSIYIF